MKIKRFTEFLIKAQWTSPVFLENVYKSGDYENCALALPDSSNIERFEEFEHQYLLAYSNNIAMSTNIHSGELKTVKISVPRFFHILGAVIILKWFPEHSRDMFVLKRPDLSNLKQQLFLINGKIATILSLSKEEALVHTPYGDRRYNLDGTDKNRDSKFDLYIIQPLLR